MSSMLGVDLGTGRNKAAFINGEGRSVPVELGMNNTMPSVVYFQEGGALIGEDAESLGLVDPSNAVFHWKRYVGSGSPVYMSSGGAAYFAKDIAVIFLKHIKEKAEKQTGLIFEHIVLTVPANYNDKQKSEMVEACREAGFSSPRFKNSTPLLIHEPTSAMLQKLVGSDKAQQADGYRLVADVGCGTTDLTLTNSQGNKHDVKQTNGIPKLGGLDYTEAMVSYCIEELKRATGADLTKEAHRSDYQALWEKVEEAKMRLGSADKITVVAAVDSHRAAVVMTKDSVRELTKDLTSRIIDSVAKTVADAGIALNDVLELVPIGGGSQFFSILEELERYFGRPLSNSGDPHLAVARGAAVKGWQELGEVKTPEGYVLTSKEFVLADTTAHAIGVMALDSNKKESFAQILAKGVRMPSTQVKTFALSEPGQTSATIRVLQGAEGIPLDECLVLGEFELENLVPIYEGPHTIEIELNIDKNGVLTAKAYDPHDGKSADLELKYDRAA